MADTLVQVWNVRYAGTMVQMRNVRYDDTLVQVGNVKSRYNTSTGEEFKIC